MTTPAHRIAAFSLTLLLLAGCATTPLSGPPETLFKEGELAFGKGNYEAAITYWKKVKESYQSPELTTKAEINIADAYFLNKDYIEAAAAYEDFRKLHPGNERAGHALYRQGLSHFNQVNGIDTDQTPVKNALISFESYLKQYPAGEYAADARTRIQTSRDMQLQYEIYVGRFYQKTGKNSSAIGRFEQALKDFPDLPRRDEVLFLLGRSYQKAGQQPKALEAFDRLLKEFPESSFAAEARSRAGR